MDITFYGAANQVTGSCHLVEDDNNRFLVDCGMFQGPRSLEKLNRIPKNLDAEKIDYVILTHGHLDHCGRLPMLVKAGFRGPVYATQGTIDIAKLILEDATHIQKGDTRRINRKRQRAGLKPIEPLFDEDDVKQVFNQFVPKPYFTSFSTSKNITVKFFEAGHILGSTSVEIKCKEIQKTLVFSGDLGPYDIPLMRDPSRISEADYVFVESTYGDRNHRDLEDTIKEFKTIVSETVKRKGKILIPSFAVGRTQTLIYYLAKLMEEKEIDPIPVYLDSPMAIKATEIYVRNSQIMDNEAKLIIQDGKLKRGAFQLTNSLSLEESKELNSVEGPCVVIAGAGMCNAGRILHHLKHNLWKPSTVVLMVGYQARGSLGKKLLDGVKKVKLFGENIFVAATVKGVGGFSAHAGQSDLIRWLEPMASKPQTQVVLIHGERKQIRKFKERIKYKFGIESLTPSIGETITL